MGSQEFIEKSKLIVADYANEHIDVTGDKTLAPGGVYVVWSCFILGNQKALLSTVLGDGMYYEVTYNAAKNEIYLDAYKKWENKKVVVEKN